MTKKDKPQVYHYNPHAVHSNSQLILHPSFGVGIITSINEGDFTVIFTKPTNNKFERVLVHNRHPETWEIF